ncbi:MAG TPA: A/G-specific adenine glycosylase [Verrucomicrobiota bacterium]|nr:A/G-specific adenine glycosylase [Verrucomicrobiales bacterium]HRI11811.1 A/G-specific adenine glycosylase [Verrucomicrobiota bacterium]
MIGARHGPAVRRTPPVPFPARWIRPLLTWFGRCARDLPWRRTRDPYAIWISEIMLQQTQVKTVIPYWERWLDALPDIQALAAATEEQVLKLWEGLGYYSRARNLQRAARQIIEVHRGKFPRDFEAILALPGIGRYTAGAIASIAFNEAEPILDGNVVRVLTRLCAWSGDPRRKPFNSRLWMLATQVVESAASRRYSALAGPSYTGSCSAINQALMELGAVVCTTRNPACPACPLNRHCEARRLGQVEQFPATGRRRPTVQQRRLVVVLERAGRYLVIRRELGAVNALLWEFPSRELRDAEDARHVAAAWFGVSPESCRTLPSVIHSITRYRIRLEVYGAKLRRSPRLEPTARWVTRADLDTLALSGAHRRIADGLPI